MHPSAFKCTKVQLSATKCNHLQPTETKCKQLHPKVQINTAHSVIQTFLEIAFIALVQSYGNVKLGIGKEVDLAAGEELAWGGSVTNGGNLSSYHIVSVSTLLVFGF